MPSDATPINVYVGFDVHTIFSIMESTRHFWRNSSVMLNMKATAGILITRLSARGVLEVLLVQSRSTSWSIPKGKVEVSETMAGAARREVFEETKVTCPEPITFVGYVTNFIKGERFYCFISHQQRAKPVANKEIVKAKFVPIAQARKLIQNYQQPLLEPLYTASRIAKAV